MKRITFVEIAGKEYPMSFSLMAAKKIAEKHGSIENMLKSVKTKGGIKAGTIDGIADLLELLIAQGCAYKNYFEKDIPVKGNDPVIDGKWTPLPREALEIAVGIEDLERMADKIAECISNSQQKELEAKEVEKKGNAKARQA